MFCFFFFPRQYIKKNNKEINLLFRMSRKGLFLFHFNLIIRRFDIFSYLFMDTCECKDFSSHPVWNLSASAIWYLFLLSDPSVQQTTIYENNAEEIKYFKVPLNCFQFYFIISQKFYLANKHLTYDYCTSLL